MAFTNSPNMNLVVPTVGSENGPTYAFDINTSLSIIDSHNHTAGSGVQITPAALNINASLPMNNQLLTAIKGLTLQAQGSAPAVSTIYMASTGYLWYKDASGTDIQITNVSGVNSGAGSINNLPFGTAAANYITGSGKFQWLSATSTAADMDFGAAIMRNTSPNSTYALTLQPPASLGANYNVTLPALPGSTCWLQITSAGVMSASVPVAAGLTTSNLSASAGIIGSQLSASANIAASQLAASNNITGSQIATATITTGNLNFTAVQTVNVAGPGLSGGGSGTSLTITQASSAGAVGTYMMAHNDANTTLSFGTDLAGSNIRPCNADATAFGTAPSGTWRTMGVTTAGANPSPGLVTMFLRIS